MEANIKASSVADTVRANVRRLRKSRGLTYVELSRQLAVIGHPIVDTSLTKIEQGGRGINVDDLVALATVLKVSAAELLGESECVTCQNKPGTGFTCNTCGRSG
jgi:transcriptional regulator with XRE-family HTH domain